MMFFSSYSRFFSTGTFYFIVMNGLFLTYVTGYFNLNSTAGMKFDCLYGWPLLFFGLLAVDSYGILDDKICIYGYLAYTLMLLVTYLTFMGSVVR